MQRYADNQEMCRPFFGKGSSSLLVKMAVHRGGCGSKDEHMMGTCHPVISLLTHLLLSTPIYVLVIIFYIYFT